MRRNLCPVCSVLREHWRMKDSLCQEGLGPHFCLMLTLIWLHNRHTLHVSVPGRHTECRLSQSDPLASVPPCPLTSMNIIPGFCHSRSFLWIQQDQGLRQKMECQRAEEGEKEETHPLFFFLFFFRHVLFIPAQGPLHPLRSLPCQSHLKHPNPGGPFYHAAHTAVPPAQSAWNPIIYCDYLFPEILVLGSEC